MALLEQELERMGLTKPPDRPLPRSISRRLLEEERRVQAAKEEAEQAHREAMVSLRAAKALKEESKPKIVPRKAWIGYAVGAGVLVLLCSVVGVAVARSSLKTSTLQQEQKSNATMSCIDGEGIAANDTNLWTWLTGGHSFQCKNWETLETKREREQAALAARAMEKEKRTKRAAGIEEQD